MIFAKVTGLASFARELSNVSKAAHVAAAARSRDIAGRMVEGMKARVPVESGNLRESIRAEPNDNGTVSVRAGGTEATLKEFAGGVFDEAVAVEFGGLHNSPKPYFYPEVDAAREEFGDEIFQAAQDATGGK